MKFIITSQVRPTSFTVIATTCPHCGHKGTFEKVGDDTTGEKLTFGLRRCPNNKCYGHLFFVYDAPSRKIIITYPSYTIPFDKENIPSNVLSAFQEAVSCHSNNCFVASAIMIRKTLEEICLEQNISGINLFVKLTNLGNSIILPKELIDGMQELRLLGNDAAHVESREFNQIGKEEIEVSIEFTKEILKAVYQYESLLNKIRSLKTHSDTEN